MDGSDYLISVLNRLNSLHSLMPEHLTSQKLHSKKVVVKEILD